MQFLLTLIICVFLALSQGAPLKDQYKEDMKQRKVMALECIDQVKIDRKIIEDAMAHPTNLPTDAKYKEFLACSYKKQKFQSQDGKILFDNIYSFLERFYERGDLRILDNCKIVTGANDGEVAYNTLKCVLHYLFELSSRDDSE
ncbi:hypothetical protein NQ318_018657 [Aromia moschata]|uniref:Uncharacterized protein n=1 Tax=Aromia moschata TaxID=1265417 RepID=A0AAV8ZIF8_9CUCU|nr:hypothetical protein NQ318_018657 [Aromia moschata]